MGYYKPAATDLLKLPTNPDYWVQMKRRATWGDDQAANAAMVNMSIEITGNGSAPAPISEMELAAHGRTLVRRLVVEWNLTDENDKPVAITDEALDLLEAEDGQFLLAEAQKRLKVRPKEQESPFETRSSQGSGGTRSSTPKRFNGSTNSRSANASAGR